MEDADEFSAWMKTVLARGDVRYTVCTKENLSRAGMSLHIATCHKCGYYTHSSGNLAVIQDIHEHIDRHHSGQAALNDLASPKD